MKCLGSYGTADCVGCITTLNTDDNRRSEPTIMKMLQFLEQQLAASTWTMKDHHVHCMEHLVDIAGQQMVQELEGNADGEGPTAMLTKVRSMSRQLRASTKLAKSLKTSCELSGLKYVCPEVGTWYKR